LLLYYITDRRQFAGSEAQRCERLIDKIAEAAQAGVNFIQLREKDLSSPALEDLATGAMAVVAKAVNNCGSLTRLLINSRVDVSIAVAADGVHLPAGEMNVLEARSIFQLAHCPSAIIGVSCHTLEEVGIAQHNSADLAVFGPVFEKAGVRIENGLDTLRRACDQLVSINASPQMRIFALGGVTLNNAQKCKEAGADGIAGIRLFQENIVADVVRTLRPL